MDSPAALILLGLIAAAAFAQAALLLSLVLKGQALAVRIEALEQELRPRLQQMGEVVDDVGEITRTALRHLPEVEHTLDDTMRRVRRTTGMVESLVAVPLKPLAAAAAIWKGIRTGASFYRASSARS
jgi:hypothetical protein